MNDSASSSGTNADQVEFWNTQGGDVWFRYHAHLETSMAGVARHVMEAGGITPGARVLEIGCGAGGMALDLARKVGPDGSVVGLDVSEPLLARARDRAAEAGLDNLEFVLEDAQTRAFDGSFDLVISRFGVMFFDDPEAAFRNILTALRPGGRLAMICWAPLADNPWFRIPARAGMERFGPQEKPDPHAPGPLAFADTERVEGILLRAGFLDVSSSVEPIDLVPPGGLDAVARLATELGPAARMLDENGGTEEDRRAIEAAVREGYRPFAGPDGLAVPSLQNLFTASAPA